MEGQMERSAIIPVLFGSDRSLASLLSEPVGWEALVAKVPVIEMGTELSEVSLLDVAGMGEAGHDMIVAGGYGALVADHARGLNTRLSATVSEIRWQETHGVTLSGTFGTIRARAAIVTVPTSVLAQNTVRFVPALPDRMQQAIADLPLGVFEKVGFRLDRARPDLPEYAFATGPEGQQLTHQLAMSEDRQIATIILAGDTARALDAEGTPARIATARSLLTDILGSDTAVGATVATNWLSDPLSLGAYSHARIGATEAREIYSTPLENRLWFAGEAAPGEHAVTVAGAWLSGESAARAATGALRA
jgi:monoamine oxidase